MKIENYIFFSGNCAQAIKFYAQALGGKIDAMMTYGESPAGEHHPPEWGDKVIHARLTVGDAVLMASDGPPDHKDSKHGFAVTLQVDTVAEADRLFNVLVEGGTVTMPIGETFFSKRFGMLTDRFGTPWMINCSQG
jgi:PhnB protein